MYWEKDKIENLTCKHAMRFCSCCCLGVCEDTLEDELLEAVVACWVPSRVMPSPSCGDGWLVRNTVKPQYSNQLYQGILTDT
jgi:hypothetical protein